MKGKGGKNKKANPFWDTVHDIRNLTKDYTNKKEKSFFNIKAAHQKQKGPKMPLPMLSGIRKKIVKDFEAKEKQKLQENVQYSSSERFHDLSFLKRKTQQQQSSNHNFLKNKYKFKDLKSKQLGTFKDGTLMLSKSEIRKINQS